MKKKIILTEQQIRSLVSQFQTSKNPRVLQPVIIQFRDMAVTFALKKLKHNDLYFDDLVQEALLAITVAATKFDLTLNTPFMDFVPIYMKQAIREFFNTYSQPVTKPKSHDFLLPIDDLEQFVIDGDGEEFENKQLPECLVVYPPDIEPDETCIKLRNRLTTLSPFEQQVIKASFGFDNQTPMDDKQLAHHLHTTTERIRHTRSEALNKLHFRLLN